MTEYSYEELITWAANCMREGIDEPYQKAWVLYTNEGSKKTINYRCIYKEGEEEHKFTPADNLYPVKCIELLNNYLEEDKKGWKNCKILFDEESIEIEYSY